MTEDSRIPDNDEAEVAEVVAPEGAAENADREVSIPDDAFFSPDGPIALAEGDIPPDAFYSPDDPLAADDDGEGIVTGMDGVDARNLGKGRGLLWEMMNTAAIMERLGRDLREHGMGALKVHPETEPMEAMLRSFVAGFLVGQIEEDS
jgi:hypothetical protein